MVRERNLVRTRSVPNSAAFIAATFAAFISLVMSRKLACAVIFPSSGCLELDSFTSAKVVNFETNQIVNQPKERRNFLEKNYDLNVFK